MSQHPLAHEEFRDQHALYLAGALTNLIDFYATPVARNRKFIHEAVAALTQDVTLGHYAIFKSQRACIRGLPPHFLVRSTNNVTRSVLRHDDIGNLIVPVRSLTGHGSNGDTTGHISASIGNKALGAIDVPGTVTQYCACPGTARVRAGFGFGQAKGP